MASRKRTSDNANRRNPGSSLAQLGLMDMPELANLGDLDMDDGSDDDNDDLEAELKAIMSGKAPPRPVRQRKIVSIDDIDKQAAECMKDISDDDADDENLSGDEQLMAELQEIIPHTAESTPSPTPLLKARAAPPPPPRPSQATQGSSLISVLEERLKLYKEAEANARSSGDGTRARRYGRAVKTLEGQLKTVKAGKPVDEEEIPPPPPPLSKSKPNEQDYTHQLSALSPTDVSTASSPTEFSSSIREDQPLPLPRENLPSQESYSATVGGTSKPDESKIHSLLSERRNQYKMAALQAKRMNEKEIAIKYVKIAKQFDSVIKAVVEGQPVDLSKMPPPPSSKYAATSQNTSQQKQFSSPQVSSEVKQTSSDEIMRYSEEPEDPDLFKAPPPPVTVLEALEQRLQKFQSTVEAAKAEGNSSKARRVGRIVKQYEDAIKLYKAGKPVDYDNLPSVPGFAPIPKEGESPPSSHKIETPPPRDPSATRPAPPPPRAAVPAVTQPQQMQPTKSPTQKTVQHKALQRGLSTIQDKQLSFLLERQKLFREAALDCKKKGDIQNAKEYLKMSKGLDPMIEATKCGLPIDATTIPTPPQLNEDFVIIEKSECEEIDEDKEERFNILEKDLSHQIDMCLKNKEYFFKLGDVLSASKFEKLALETKRDLGVVQNLWKRGDPLPRYHYETRVFSMVQSHADLSDSELELSIERGFNLPGKPDDLDSYIRIEFPFPNDNPVKLKSHTVKDTNNPVYKATFKIEFNRKSRSIIRSFKKSIKLEVWCKGGFFRSDSLLGTAYVKLAELETKCTLHDSFSLMEGRKNCGGGLEVKVRIREPLLAKQVENVKERWLVIGS